MASQVASQLPNGVRRVVRLNKAARVQTLLSDQAKSATFDRLKDRVDHSAAVASSEVELLSAM